MILKWVELRGPLSAVWKTAIAFPNQPNSKPTIPNQTNQFQPNQPPAGPAPQEAVRPARGLGRSPIFKKYFLSLLTSWRHTRGKAGPETHFATSHGGGTGDSILHCRSLRPWFGRSKPLGLDRRGEWPPQPRGPSGADRSAPAPPDAQSTWVPARLPGR